MSNIKSSPIFANRTAIIIMMKEKTILSYELKSCSLNYFE